MIVKTILRQKISATRVTYRDAQSYFAILLDDNNRKTICRLYLNGSKKYFVTLDVLKKEVKNERKVKRKRTVRKKNVEEKKARIKKSPKRMQRKKEKKIRLKSTFFLEVVKLVID